MDSVASGTPYTFQQDSAPAHTAEIVQSWLKKNGKLEREVYATHNSNMTSLKASIKSEIHKLDPAEVSTDCERFRRRLEDILEAEGGQVE
ncbi:Transposable element tcb2 transposase [Caligus rogercresseyi]|uniref:Transposable element tcb2 transposase n=1 Tax=Caligus rogercresseyi TaxID=217165 RepID=A0A7T8JZ74_CALRO|nr:Transposable element tcb2 transposase [Caligus rogercresseyi]